MIDTAADGEAGSGSPTGKQSYLSCLGCFGFLVVVSIVIGVVTSDSDDTSSKSPTAVSSTLPLESADDADIGTLANAATQSAEQQVVGWYNGGGSTYVDAIVTDLATVDTDTNDLDFESMSTDCEALDSDVADAQLYDEVPDDEAQWHWDAALNSLRSGAAHCSSGASAYDPNLMIQAGQEFSLAGGELDAVTSRLQALATD
jgi:hypothetical protein